MSLTACDMFLSTFFYCYKYFISIVQIFVSLNLNEIFQFFHKQKRKRKASWLIYYYFLVLLSSGKCYCGKKCISCYAHIEMQKWDTVMKLIHFVTSQKSKQALLSCQAMTTLVLYFVEWNYIISCIYFLHHIVTVTWKTELNTGGFQVTTSCFICIVTGE